MLMEEEASPVRTTSVDLSTENKKSEKLGTELEKSQEFAEHIPDIVSGGTFKIDDQSVKYHLGVVP